jgi:hypothetical protein
MDESAGALRYPVRMTGGWQKLGQTGAPRLGAAPGYPATLMQLAALRPFFAGEALSWPGAETLVRELVTLPTHSQVSPSERSQLVDIICKSRLQGN